MVHKKTISGIVAFTAFVVVFVFSSLHAQSAKIETAYTIKEKDIFPEGIIFDINEKAFYIGSMLKCKIIKIDSNGIMGDFKSEKEDGLLSVLGMKVDSERRILWVCAYGESHTEERGYSGIYKFNLNNGKLINKYLLGNKNERHLFNDIVITHSGDVYFTDTLTGEIYTINSKNDLLSVFIKPDIFKYPNGIALSPNDKYLYVADSRGIQRVDMKGVVKELIHPEGMVTNGIDGLYFYKNSLVAIQNNIKPERIVKFILDKNLEEITEIAILCQDNPLVYIPTTGVIVGNFFYIIGNSQLHLRKDGKITDYEKLEDVRIVKIQL